MNLRQMIFGKKCFRAIVDEDLTLCGETWVGAMKRKTCRSWRRCPSARAVSRSWIASCC